jgi:xanthine dehydrogenase YagR molybdenum-binding subunit
VTAVGLPLDRVDGPLKVTGAADYAADIRPAGLVHAVLLGSAVARGRVTHIDASTAERAEGVLGCSLRSPERLWYSHARASSY